MQRADDFTALDPAVAQLTAFVRTNVLNAVEFAVVFEDSHLVPFQAHQFGRAFGDLIGAKRSASLL